MPQYHRREVLRTAALLGASAPLGGFALGDGPKRPSSPFLEGNYGPVREETTIDALEVVGKIPADLEGMYLRNGPNPQFPPKGHYHWFDGDGMIHGVRLAGGKASYRNRFVQTPGLIEEKAAGKALYGGLADMPDIAKLAKGGSPYKNVANTALAWHDGKLLALWEGGEPYRVRLPGLDTVGGETFGGKLRHAFTAHPKVDPATGEMLFFGYQPVGPYLQYSVVGPDGAIRSTTPIELPRPVMMHDFAVTETKTVFMDLPATFDFKRMMAGGPMLKYEPDRGARFGVLPRHGKGSEIRWFSSPSCYVFHTLNAHDEGDEVVLTAARLDAYPDDLATKPTEARTNPVPTRLYRWRFNLKTGATTEGPLDDVSADFPRLADARLGRDNRYGYLTKAEWAGLIKYDLKAGTSRHHDFGPGRLAGEGVFVPRDGSKAEDDGYVLTFVFDQAAQASELVVLSAEDFAAAPLARVKIPRRVPHGFHGIWVTADQLAHQHA